MHCKISLSHVMLACLAVTGLAAEAAPIVWNTWSSSSAGSITTDTGTIDVGFAGNPTNFFAGFPSYNPPATWADGTIVDNGPVAANGIVQLVGGSDAVQTLTFSVPVVDPVMAIWSLGQPRTSASFVFLDATPLFVSGGPNAEFGGSTIGVSGNTVSGVEGNGTVQFKGTFTSISWTNPQFENWYGFNVGVAGLAAPIPEPQSMALMLAGLGALGAALRRRRTQTPA